MVLIWRRRRKGVTLEKEKAVVDAKLENWVAELEEELKV
jgi:hypothetical protein